MKRIDFVVMVAAVLVVLLIAGCVSAPQKETSTSAETTSTPTQQPQTTTSTQTTYASPQPQTTTSTQTTYTSPQPQTTTSTQTTVKGGGNKSPRY
jgi:outer membrane murein-binding lipoprotein Lpp